MKVWYDSNRTATSFLPLRIRQQNVKLGYPSNLIQERKSVTLPGPEDGHLHMPNYLVERFMKLHLSGAQWQVLWAVWRRTLCGPWGSNRSAPISLSDLAADTQLHRQAVAREVSALTKMNIIFRDPATRVTSFNPDPSTWVKRKVAAKSLWESSSKSGNKAASQEEVI